MTSASAAAATAYDALADTYDDLTKAYDYETWLSRLVAVAERNGLRGRRPCSTSRAGRARASPRCSSAATA
jgi:hypothetical protein